MKLKSRSVFDRVHRRFPPVPLYLQDLEQIVAGATARGLKVEIADDQHEYESLVDVRENCAPRVRKLTLRFSEGASGPGRADVDIAPDGITVSANRTDLMLVFWHEVVDLINGRMPWYAKFMQPFGWLVMCFAIGLAPTRAEPRSITWSIQIALIGVSFALCLMSLYYVRSSRGVHLRKEYEVSGLWDRYGEKVVLIIIGAVVGLGAKWIRDHLLS